MQIRLIAWIALFATLFSAASPTLAAAVLSHESAALARMLGIPAAAAADREAGDHAHVTHDGHDTPAPHHSHDGHHGTAHDDSDDGSSQSHAAHGIHCSLCLNPSSIATIAPASVSIPALSLEYHVPSPTLSAPRYAAFHPLYRSRAPPRVS